MPALLLDDLLPHLGLRLESYDLRSKYGTPDVLGEIYFEDKLIRIDETLDADERPAMRGRFNFSYAHEIGLADRHELYRLIENEHVYFVAQVRAEDGASASRREA